MKKINSIVLALVIVLSATGAIAQNSGSLGIGVRVSPDGGGFTAKYFADRNVSFEFQLNGSMGYFNSDNDGPSVVVVGLLEYNIAFSDPSWRIYFGPGIHGGTWNRYGNGPDGFDRNRNQGIFGIDGIFGAEYIFKKVPIGPSADIKPAMNFASDVAFFPNNIFGVSARYYFGHKPMHSTMHRNPNNG